MNANIKHLCTLIISAIPFCSFSQDANDPVLLSVGGQNITKTEFERVYRKNNLKDTPSDKKNIREYLELFINYKLKVKEAETMGLDTSEAFKTELSGYRKQLAQPYLVDREVTTKLIREAYDRMQLDIRASHILIKVDQDALPKDTLAAYNRILKIREMIMKGADFSKIARDSSGDPSAKENGGDLGYFTALMKDRPMVYGFETGAYNTKPGEVSMPVRTQFGYHLIKITDSRKAQGEIYSAHIMVRAPRKPADGAPDSVMAKYKEESEKAKNKIEDIHKKVIAGESFEDLARTHSDDKATGRSGGTLPWFGTGRMVPEFEVVAFSLKANGDVSKPFLSPFGWHIVKRLDKKELPSFEEMQNEIKSRISSARDGRADMGRTSLINKIKKEYKFTETPKAKDDFYKVVDSTLWQGKWEIEKAKSLTKVMFTLMEKAYTQQDFAKYIADHQVHRNPIDPRGLINSMYDVFVNESCIAFEESRLDQKYPEFRALMQEYRDGILLFDLTDKKVWSKAVKDTVGLKEFYNKNKNNYMWNQRLEAVIYTCSNAEIANQVRKTMKKKGISRDSLLKIINKGSELNLSLKEGRFSVGDEKAIDSIKWEKGISPDVTVEKSVVFVEVKAVLPPMPKTLDEARGLVTTDYQAWLEKDWIESLKKKYPVTIREDVLSTIAP